MVGSLFSFLAFSFSFLPSRYSLPDAWLLDALAITESLGGDVEIIFYFQKKSLGERVFRVKVFRKKREERIKVGKQAILFFPIYGGLSFLHFSGNERAQVSEPEHQRPYHFVFSLGASFAAQVSSRFSRNHFVWEQTHTHTQTTHKHRRRQRLTKLDEEKKKRSNEKT